MGQSASPSRKCLTPMLWGLFRNTPAPDITYQRKMEISKKERKQNYLYRSALKQAWRQATSLIHKQKSPHKPNSNTSSGFANCTLMLGKNLWSGAEREMAAARIKMLVLWDFSTGHQSLGTRGDGGWGDPRWLAWNKARGKQWASPAATALDRQGPPLQVEVLAGLFPPLHL